MRLVQIQSGVNKPELPAAATKSLSLYLKLHLCLCLRVSIEFRSRRQFAEWRDVLDVVRRVPKGLWQSTLKFDCYVLFDGPVADSL